MPAVGVVGDLERTVPRGDGVGFGPQCLGLLRVVVQHFGAGERVGPAGDDRRGEVAGGGAGALEDHLGDLLAVDRHGDRLTTQVAFLALEVREALGDREGLEDRRGLIHRAVAQVVLEGCQSVVRNSVQNVEVAAEQVGVGRILGGVEDDIQAAVLGRAATCVVRVSEERDLDIVFPRGVAGELVRTVADGVGTKGLHVLEGDIRKRVEGRVPEAQREVRGRLGQRDREGVVVDLLQAGQL